MVGKVSSIRDQIKSFRRHQRPSDNSSVCGGLVGSRITGKRRERGGSKMRFICHRIRSIYGHPYDKKLFLKRVQIKVDVGGPGCGLWRKKWDFEV